MKTMKMPLTMATNIKEISLRATVTMVAFRDIPSFRSYACRCISINLSIRHVIFQLLTQASHGFIFLISLFQTSALKLRYTLLYSGKTRSSQRFEKVEAAFTCKHGGKESGIRLQPCRSRAVEIEFELHSHSTTNHK